MKDAKTEDVLDLHNLSRYSSGEDYRFAGPVQECLCGGDMFHVLASFDEAGEVAYYLLDGVCWSCGAVVTLPTPIKPDAFVEGE